MSGTVEYRRQTTVSKVEPVDPNMISNGTFDSSTGWTLTGGWSIAGGILSYDGINWQYATQTNANMVSPIQPSTAYILEFDVLATSDYQAYTDITSSDYGVEYVAPAGYAIGTRAHIHFTTPSNIGVGGIRFQGLAPEAFEIDNVVLILDE